MQDYITTEWNHNGIVSSELYIYDNDVHVDTLIMNTYDGEACGGLAEAAEVAYSNLKGTPYHLTEQYVMDVARELTE